MGCSGSQSSSFPLPLGYQPGRNWISGAIPPVWKSFDGHWCRGSVFSVSLSETNKQHLLEGTDVFLHLKQTNRTCWRKWMCSSSLVLISISQKQEENKIKQITKEKGKKQKLPQIFRTYHTCHMHTISYMHTTSCTIHIIAHHTSHRPYHTHTIHAKICAIQK